MASGVGRKAARRARKANRQAKKATANPLVELVARWGYVVRGLLYGAMGLVALLLAVGRVSHGTDQKGALHYFISNPFGTAVLGTFAVGLAGYSLWGVVRAVYDPLNRGHAPTGLVARLGFAWSGIAYASLLLAVVQVLLGARGTLAKDSVETFVSSALAAPAGQLATGVAGVIAIGAGLAQFVDAWRAGWAKDLKKGEMTQEEWLTAVWFGRFGLVSRGVVFAMTGWFILDAALHQDATRAHGFGAAFDRLLQEPFGHAIVAVVGLGFIALAMHSAAYARWVRMMGSRHR
jgi:hypothetical protein